MPRRHNSTGRSRRSSRFLMLEHFLLKSSAWQSLPAVPRAAYIEIAQRYSPGNNGRIAVSGRMLATALSVSRQTANRALSDLVERGFIEPMKAGAFNIKSGERRATEWRLTSYKCDVTGAVPSRNFMRWHAGKIHLTDPPRGQTGPATGPVDDDAQQYCRMVAYS
jgi:hypothetical protein